MRDALVYAVIAVTMIFWLFPAVGVFVQIGREATTKEWLEAIPGIGLLLSLGAMPINLDAGILGTMFFVMLLLRRKELPSR
jgi:hypothetical protein